MIETVLGIIKDEMKAIDVPYEFMMWTSPVIDRYWVGEYTETSTSTEDGYEEGTLLLTGTTNGYWLELMQDIGKMKDRFPKEGGFRKSTENGAVVIFYDFGFTVPTGEANLKRIQVNLNIKTWKGLK